MIKLYKVCQKCNIDFIKKSTESLKFWSNRKYCSRSCASSVNVTGTKRALGTVGWNLGLKFGKSHLNTSIDKKCEYCSNTYSVQKYRILTSKFCSKSCKHKDMDKGISTENEKIRKSKQYKEWRLSIFKRDNFTCVICKIKNKKGMGKTIELYADHIKSFAHHKDLRFEIDNGRTLCVDCHRKTDNFGFKAKKDVIGYNIQA